MYFAYYTDVGIKCLYCTNLLLFFKRIIFFLIFFYFSYVLFSFFNIFYPSFFLVLNHFKAALKHVGKTTMYKATKGCKYNTWYCWNFQAGIKAPRIRIIPHSAALTRVGYRPRMKYKKMKISTIWKGMTGPSWIYARPQASLSVSTDIMLAI